MRRPVFHAALLVTAYLIGVTVFNRLPLPSARPDLLLVVVVALALVEGPLRGTVLGFGAGLLADLATPADHTVGRLALAYAVVGYLAGLLEDVEERSAIAPMVIVGVATVGAVLLYAAVGGIVGDARVTWAAIRGTLPLTVLYDVVLSPFVVPFVASVVRRLEPEGLSR